MGDAAGHLADRGEAIELGLPGGVLRLVSVLDQGQIQIEPLVQGPAGPTELRRVAPPSIFKRLGEARSETRNGDIGVDLG